MIITSLVCFTGCDSRYDHEILTEKYFEYYIENGEIEICGFTKLGYAQKVLVVPAKIDGYPVVRFGGDMAFMWDDIQWTNLSKVIFLSNKTKSINLFSPKDSRITRVVFVDFDTSEFQLDCYNSDATYYAPPRLYEDIREIISRAPDDFVMKTNVSYLYNYEGAPNHNYFMADYLENGELFFCPNRPERDGYIFEGWTLSPDSEEYVSVNSLLKQEGNVTFYAQWKKAE